MRKIVYAFIFNLCFVTGWLAGATRSEAALEETAQSIENDRKALSTCALALQFAMATQCMKLIPVQYISPSGIVFAVAWNGLAASSIPGRRVVFSGCKLIT